MEIYTYIHVTETAPHSLPWYLQDCSLLHQSLGITPPEWSPVYIVPVVILVILVRVSSPPEKLTGVICYQTPAAHVRSTDAISPTSLHPPCTTGTATTSGSDVCCTLLDAMEGACRGVLSLVCRVLRVYRRAVYTAGTLFS